MIDYVGMVREFMEKQNQFIADSPQDDWGIPYNLTKLRLNLINEEYLELRRAKTKQKIAKELADLLYVTFGMALTYGIPIDDIFTEVHKSNMTKGNDRNEHGKVLKGSTYEPPNLKQFLG